MRPEVKIKKRKSRHMRVRKKVIGTPERPRIVVKKSLKHIYAQIVVDRPFDTCLVLLGASSLSPQIRDDVKSLKGKIEKARLVGKLLARRALEKGIKKVVFDRSGYKYHGRIKALAEGAREGGLEF